MNPLSPIVKRFKLMAAAALADGEIGAEEKAQLVQFAKKLGIAPADATAIFKDVSQGGGVSMFPPGEEAERRAIFCDVVQLLAADGHLAAKEETFLSRLAESYSIPSADVHKIVERSMPRTEYEVALVVAGGGAARVMRALALREKHFSMKEAAGAGEPEEIPYEDVASVDLSCVGSSAFQCHLKLRSGRDLCFEGYPVEKGLGYGAFVPALHAALIPLKEKIKFRLGKGWRLWGKEYDPAHLPESYLPPHASTGPKE